MKIAVAGTGYVGLVTAVTLAHIGHDITCVDVDEKKIKMMRRGISPIYEQDLEELMRENKERLIYTTDYLNAYRDKDVIFIGVGTPEKKDGSANLEYLYTVCDQIIESINKDVVIVIKSTVPIGTNDTIDKYLDEKIKGKYKIEVVSNPEFLAQGTAVHDTLYATRIVVGAEKSYAKGVMTKLYEPLTKNPYNVPFLIMDRKSAEMVKYASNDFLALKISYINEIANFCEKLGADISLVTKGMSYDPRIGEKFLNAGIGYGGSCFPKDTKALHWLSRENGTELKTIKAGIEVNKNQKIRLFIKMKDKFKSLNNLTIAVLGLTFKAGTDDIREAPSIDNIELLLDANANIKAYDPIGIDNFKRVTANSQTFNQYRENITYHDNIDDTISDADVVLIMTDWDEIKNYPIDKFERLMKTPYIFDGRNCYLPNTLKKHAVYYNSIGRKVVDNLKNKVLV